MQPSERTYCIECRHMYQVGKHDAPWLWLCIKHPRMEGMGYVTPYSWVAAEPYLRCKDVNGGACVLFERGDPKQIALFAKEKNDAA